MTTDGDRKEPAWVWNFAWGLSMLVSTALVIAGVYWLFNKVGII